MRTLGVLGAGVIGAGWAARFALMGWRVRVHDPDPEARRKLDAVLGGAARALPMLYEAPMPERGPVTLCDTLRDAVAGADFIVESVPEQLALKRRVLAEAQAACPPGTVIGSSTSGFKPSDLQTGAPDPARILVAHPFNPVYLLPLVELVGGAAPEATVRAVADILRGVGMHPLPIGKEIDAHIADRLLESVWREALWLVRDGVATTAEIDDAIRYGLGLRWGQMGLFETYRIAGGEAGMRHFLAQFGPALAWPWSRLTDVPALDDALVETIAAQSDAQAGGRSIRALERLRDDNLVAMLRALKQQEAAAGALIRAHDDSLRRPLDETAPMVTVRRTVPVDWTDMNGHMNEGRYGQLFSDASEALMHHVGADRAYVAAGNSYFTAETNIRYLAETHAGEAIFVETTVTQGEGKKLRLWHEMKRAEDGTLMATCDQFMLHVSLVSRRSCPPLPAVAEAVERLARAHGAA
jgi:carnitine 3-dehydrogenase